LAIIDEEESKLLKISEILEDAWIIKSSEEKGKISDKLLNKTIDKEKLNIELEGKTYN
jgi:hypothetical protein